MKRTVYFIFVMMMILSLAACNATPASHWAKIQKAGKIVIGTSADYPPFEYVDESGNFAGFDVDIITEMASRLGLELEIVDMPFDSLVAAVKEGKIDAAIAAFNYNEERDQSVDFTDAYFYQENGFLVSSAFNGTIDKPEDAANYKLGVQTGAMADDWATTTLVEGGLMSAENLYRYERVDQAGLDVKNGRIDVLMADYYPLLTLQQQYSDLKIVYHGEVAAGPVMMIIPDGDSETKTAMDQILKAMLDDGFVDKAATTHFGSIE